MRPQANIKLVQEQVQKKHGYRSIHAQKNQNNRRNYARLLRTIAFTFAFGAVKDL